MFFIDHISSASVLDFQALIMNVFSKKYVLNQNAVRINHTDNSIKIGAHVNTNWLAYCYHYL